MAAANLTVEFRFAHWALAFAAICRWANIRPDRIADLTSVVVDHGVYVRLRSAGPWRRLATLNMKRIGWRPWLHAKLLFAREKARRSL